MAELHKRWSSMHRNQSVYIPGHSHYSNGYRWFLGSTADEGAYMACIEAVDLENGPFSLEIWDADEGWEAAGVFPTLKQAKAMGRLLGGLSLQQIPQGE